jgi:hypothetical protein
MMAHQIIQGRICNDFVKEYGNIHLITQKNKGLSAAAK